MNLPAIIKIGKLQAILLRTTKSHAFLIPIISSTLRKKRISLHKLENCEILEVNVKETIEKHRHHKSGISMEVYNELNAVLKGLNEQHNSN
jgi:hypothetical protein|tara:strand:+ start:727 stop:999 length:273 start_codon:yes stop_codon:yes gene_type:complete